jgi:hypothetical protein
VPTYLPACLPAYLPSFFVFPSNKITEKKKDRINHNNRMVWYEWMDE